MKTLLAFLLTIGSVQAALPPAQTSEQATPQRKVKKKKEKHAKQKGKTPYLTKGPVHERPVPF